MKPATIAHPQKEFYSLTELLIHKLVPLKSKQLHVRFKKLVSEEILVYGVNLFKEGSSWQIHHSIIPYFNYASVMKMM